MMREGTEGGYSADRISNISEFLAEIDEKDIERVKQFRTDFADVTARLGEIEVELLNTQIILDNIE